MLPEDKAFERVEWNVHMTPKITLTDAPTPEMWQAIVEPLVKFNNSRIYLTKRLGSSWPPSR